MKSNILNRIAKTISNKQNLTVGIIGLGHVGLTLSLFFCEKGIRVVGIDIDEQRIKKINQGISPVNETNYFTLVKKYVSQGMLKASTDMENVRDRDVIIITVGTPLKENNIPDMGGIEIVSNALGSHLRQGHLIIIKSTVTPGVTQEIVRPILEQKSGLRVGKDFGLAFCPERFAEGGSMKTFKGSALQDFKKLPVIVGGMDLKSTRLVAKFWKSVGLKVVIVRSPKEAEMVKLADNWWIDLNIALANELALLCEKLGISARDVIRAANTLPKGENKVNILFPGAGVGGSCLPKDPWFVYQLGKKYGLELKLPRVSREINVSMPKHMYELVTQALKSNNKSIRESRITILGLSFKNSTGDMRNSPAIDLIKLLNKEQAKVITFDPWVDKNEAKKLINKEKLSVRLANSLHEALKNTDCIVLVTAHPEFRSIPLKEIRSWVASKCGIVDGRWTFDAKEAIKAGFSYQAVGLGAI